MLSKNPKFDYSFSPTSIGHNSLNINLNYAKFIFKLNYRMSTFQWNKYYLKIICGSKVITKTMKKISFFRIIFKAIWTLLSCNCFQTIVNSPLLPSILIYGLGLCPIASFTGHVEMWTRVQNWTCVRVLACPMKLAIG